VITSRYEPYLRKAIQLLVAKHHPQYVEPELGGTNLKEFWIGFYNVSGIQKLRALRCSLIGRLLCVSATVTRTSEVRPELLYGVFHCNECGTQAGEGVEQQFKYTEPSRCTNEACTNINKWQLNLTQSRYNKFQYSVKNFTNILQK
jgi:DNA replication licensing factor MCM6